MVRNLILSGGFQHVHDFADTNGALAAVLDAAGVESEISTEIEEALESLHTERYDLVTVNMLRFRMEPEHYESDRAEHAFSLSPRGCRHLVEFLEEGGGLVALHTASICFDDWPEWGGILGARWDWERSHHDPPGPTDVQVLGGHRVTAGVEDFSVVDEVYCDLNHIAPVELLATAKGQPVVWVRRHGAGRVFHDLLGHDRDSIEEPAHSRLLRQGALWAAGPAAPPH